MSHFYGIVEGQAKTQATRRGSKRKGSTTTAASWQGAVKVELSHDEMTGRDMVVVRLTPWRGVGQSKLLYEGPVNPDGFGFPHADFTRANVSPLVAGHPFPGAIYANPAA